MKDVAGCCHSTGSKVISCSRGRRMPKSVYRYASSCSSWLASTGRPVGDGVMAGNGAIIKEDNGVCTGGGRILTKPKLGADKARLGSAEAVDGIACGFNTLGIEITIEGARTKEVGNEGTML